MNDWEMSIMSPVCTIRSAPSAFVCLTISRIFSSDMWIPACTSERCAMRNPFSGNGRSGKTSVRRVIDGKRSALQMPYAENPTPIAPYAYVGSFVRATTHDERRTTHGPHDTLPDEVQSDQATKNPAEELPRDPGRDVGDPADAPQASREHPHPDDKPRDVEDDEAEREPAAGRERQALAQVEVQQHLGRCEQQQIN